MSVEWTILDSAGAAILADFGFATYVDFADRQPGQEVGTGGTTRTTRLSVGRTGEPAVFFIKVYRYAGRHWRHRFRRDKASLEAANYELLDAIGIGTPPVVAHGSRRRGLRLIDAVIVTRGLPDVMNLDQLFATRWPDAAQHARDATRADVLNAMLREVRRMHDAGFFHVDLQWRNILIGGLSDRPSTIRHQPLDETGPIRVYLLDAPRGGLRRDRWRQPHARLRDLSCLFKKARRRMSRTEQMRWLLTYLDQPHLTAKARAIAEALLWDRTVKDNE